MATTIVVAVRVRPSFGTLDGDEDSVLTVCDHSVLVNSESKSERNQKELVGRNFTYDRCFGPESTQEEIFEALGRSALDSSISGYNATVFAYGQTGSGKTFSMLGEDLSGSSNVEPDLINDELEPSDGIVPRYFKELLQMLQHEGNMLASDGEEMKRMAGARCDTPITVHLVELSYLELYNERVTDLLVEQEEDGPGLQHYESRFETTQKGGPVHLRVREDKKRGPYVDGLSQWSVTTYSQIRQLLLQGGSMRQTAATSANEQSSRSHAMITILISQTEVLPESMAATDRHSKISFIDLAGSERQSLTGAKGQRLKEANAINKSLSTLSLVIKMLAKAQQGQSPGAKREKVSERGSIQSDRADANADVLTDEDSTRSTSSDSTRGRSQRATRGQPKGERSKSKEPVSDLKEPVRLAHHAFEIVLLFICCCGLAASERITVCC
jgi:hypothetical protein